MRSFEIIVAEPQFHSRRTEARRGQREEGPRLRSGPPRHVDLFVHGANVTARVAEGQGTCVLRDMAYAVLDLCARPTGKRIIRFYDDAFELCLERQNAACLVSVYRGGVDPELVTSDQEVPFADVVSGILDGLRAVRPLPAELRELSDRLAHTEVVMGEGTVLSPLPGNVETPAEAPLGFSCEFSIRPSPRGIDETSETSDLHALLFLGALKLDVRGRSVDLGACHPFLVAERLVRVVPELIEAWENGEPRAFRLLGSDTLLRAKLGSAGEISLIVGSRTEHAAYTFPGLSVFDLAEAILVFARGLFRAVLRRDRTQSMNLRFSGLRRLVREATHRARAADRADSKINPAPESYRQYVEQTSRAPESSVRARLRYGSRWRALVPGIDLRATFLCGTRLIVGAAGQMYSLDRTTGDVEWRAPITKATSVVTPCGIARIASDGQVVLHDFGTGDVVLRTWISPRLGGPMTGAVVHAPGLPRLLVATEGEKHLVAIDLMTGEPRWRYMWGAAGGLRLKRSGRLLYVASGDNSLTALDVQSGAVVWRLRDRLRIRVAPVPDEHELLVVSGGAGGPMALSVVDAFSGELKVRRDLPAGTVDAGPLVSTGAVALAIREARGVRLTGFDRKTGDVAWRTKGPVASVGTSWLAVDDRLIGNSPTGELVAVDATNGETAYRKSFGRVVDSDVPRRLEPVLRSGALFIPHSDIHVIAPRDGALLGQIACQDAIPDLLRVDESCAVYVAEESGHVVSFNAMARLSLVKSA